MGATGYAPAMTTDATGTADDTEPAGHADDAATIGVAEAADLLGTSMMAVREAIHAGRLPATRETYLAPWQLARQDVLDYQAGRLRLPPPELVRELGALTDAVEQAQQVLDDALAQRADALIRHREAGTGPAVIGAAARLGRQRVHRIIVNRRAQLAELADTA